LTSVVEITIKRAMVQNGYTIFYGKLVEDLVRREAELRGEGEVKAVFKSAILSRLNTLVQDFIISEERVKLKDDSMKYTIFSG